ncbi:VOC family protein [Deinococcus maricopensis]|uniref:Glyoxalase/bleomycin resistance protein/dioxygenase n=1 Tax=Deinococcus maricopensis (strain DSM 21211 / LMG 22137 / NRRL B-23946 / LB-34) TaxID=709986 RepID=E8U4E7_DEIML|nr:VOC family protein [Deinococcus maricopensis]ADV65984.1 Glyoxalase/bleomycin resistance protein/dioxygenase [Deinococcus maricopensis DSM 21211]
MTQPTTPTLTDLTLGPVELSVADLGRSVAFYAHVLGMAVLDRAPTTATLGHPAQPLLLLTEQPGAQPARPTAPGLYHFAVLLPTRADLARWVQHAASTGLRIGQSDHLVSEAFYLQDPDGHGIEVYRDRPRDTWRWQDGHVQMAGDPIDLQGLLAEPGADAPFTGLPAGTVMGHVHLRVSDLNATETFYRDVLGFDVVARWPGALFISVHGYHHHFGLNTWGGARRAPAGETASALMRVNVNLPHATDLDALGARLHRADVPFHRERDTLDVHDPAGNPLRFRHGP